MALSPGEETTLLRALCFWRMSRRASPEQIHELKRDKFRSSPRRMEIRMRLWSRNGRDWWVEFVAITSAIMALPVTRIVLDGEAVAHCPKSLPSPSRRRYAGSSTRRMRWTSRLSLGVLFSVCAGDLVVKSGASAGSFVRPPDHSCLAGLRRSRTPLPGPRGRHWPTKCS